MIALKNVAFSYAGCKKTLRDFSLSVAPGECVLLCGKSGCGKTTVTRLINGLIPHFYENCSLAGTVTVAGKSVPDTELYELAKTVGSVFQNPKSQFFHLNSDAELAFGLENRGMPRNEMVNRLERTVSDLHMKKLLHRNTFELSGGEKQALAFACVHAMGPEVYVLDEPTANLDEEAIFLLREQIRRVKGEGKTVVIAEHRLWFLADLIDRAVYLSDGRAAGVYSGEEFLSLTDKQRVSMGLRTIVPVQLPESSSCNHGEFSVTDLSYGGKNKTIFERLSFFAERGEVLGVVGPNGAGKTSLLRCLSGLAEPAGGTVAMNGVPLKKKERSRLCSLIMQDVNHQLFSDSVWGECELCGKAVSKESIRKVLARFGLTGYEERHPMALSGGEKQRLAIAAGVLSEKPVLLFDEPTSGLDYIHMLAVAETLRQLAQSGRVVIVVTHDAELLERCADRILRLEGNR